MRDNFNKNALCARGEAISFFFRETKKHIESEGFLEAAGRQDFGSSSDQFGLCVRQWPQWVLAHAEKPALRAAAGAPCRCSHQISWLTPLTRRRTQNIDAVRSIDSLYVQFADRSKRRTCPRGACAFLSFSRRCAAALSFSLRSLSLRCGSLFLSSLSLALPLALTMVLTPAGGCGSGSGSDTGGSLLFR